MINKRIKPFSLFMTLLLLLYSCNLPSPSTETPSPIPPTDTPTLAPPTEPPTPSLVHTAFPVSAPQAKLFYDVESASTAPEKRAPYGDSYDINRLERPFLQDMTYIPDLDIRSFSISKDGEWYFVSIGLVGNDPNNSMGINYGVEIDTNIDGFGDFVIVAVPPYTTEWKTENVRVLADSNRNSAGISSARSDAPYKSDGYETLIFDGNGSLGEDKDLAWVRINASQYETVQFAFKRSWAGASFLFGVFADAGLKDVALLDYIDRFTEQEAGSPVKDKKYYPLQALFAIDNSCQESVGYEATGYEPKICPHVVVQPTRGPGQPPLPDPTTVSGCQDPGNCPFGWADEPYCVCIPG